MLPNLTAGLISGCHLALSRVRSEETLYSNSPTHDLMVAQSNISPLLQRDLCNSLKLSSDLGAAGVLVWSTDRTMTRARCHTIRVNVAHSFGP